MSDKLLPCPFCGSSDVQEDGAGVYGKPETAVAWVVCQRCGGSGPANAIGEEVRAAKDWNTRTPPEGYVLVPKDEGFPVVLLPKDTDKITKA